MKIVHISMADFNGAGLCAYRICKAQRAMGRKFNIELQSQVRV